MVGKVACLMVVAGLLVAPAAGWAQNRAKPKRCLTNAEVTTEQTVRHGVFLRESGNRCEDGFTPGTRKLWEDFDQNFGPRLKAQTDRRKAVYQREFKENWVKVMTYFDGRLVTYHRHVPLTMGYCANIRDMLQEITRKGWKGFTDQAKVVQNEVLLDYKVCK